MIALNNSTRISLLPTAPAPRPNALNQRYEDSSLNKFILSPYLNMSICCGSFLRSISSIIGGISSLILSLPILQYSGDSSRLMPSLFRRDATNWVVPAPPMEYEK